MGDAAGGAVTFGTRMVQVSKYTGGNPRRNRATDAGDEVTLLKDVLVEFMAERILPRQGLFEQVSGAWERAVCEEVASHCRLAGFSGGTVQVKVNSPSGLYQLQLAKGELLEEMQRLAPRCGISNISFAIE